MSEEWCAHGLSLNCKDCRIEQLEAYNAEHQSVCQLQEQHIDRLTGYICCKNCNEGKPCYWRNNDED